MLLISSAFLPNHSILFSDFQIDLATFHGVCFDSWPFGYLQNKFHLICSLFTWYHMVNQAVRWQKRLERPPALPTQRKRLNQARFIVDLHHPNVEWEQ